VKDFLLQIQSQFQKYWQNLSLVQKITISFLALLILVSLIGFTFWAAKPEYSVLFSKLSSQDASSTINKLKEMKIPYRLSREGTSVSVPTKDVYELRLSLAGEGIPQGGGVGYEIFDKSFFGMTEFTQQLNFQRALQGELERTIREISGVEGVRVHLVMPKEELFVEEKKEGSASVLLKLAPGAKLRKAQIRGIVNLVKTSVADLSEENISIIDTRGNILSDVLEEEIQIAGTVSDVFQMKKKIERDLQGEVRMLLERILGPGKVAVKANVELNLTREETTAEEYSPVVDETNGIVRSEQKKIEYYKGSQDQSGGVPGVASNTGGVPSYPSGGGGGGSSDYTKEETVTNFEVNKKLSHILSVPGEITKITISVLLDGDFAEEITSTMKQVVASAIGIDMARGDEVVVESFQFDKTYLEEEQQESERLEKIEFRNLLVKSGVVGLVCVIILLFSVSMVRHNQVMKQAAKRIRKTQEAQLQAGAEAAVPEAAAGAEAIKKVYGPSDESNEIKKQVQDIARTEPDKLAKVIKEFLSGS